MLLFYSLIFLLFQNLACQAAFEFNQSSAESLYNSGGAPLKAELQTSGWLQIGGLFVGSSEKAPWPVGYQEKGLYRKYRDSRKMPQESRIYKTFQTSSLGFEMIENYTEGTSALPWIGFSFAVDLSESAATMVLVEEKATANPEFFPASGFVERCKILRPSQLICGRFRTPKSKSDSLHPYYYSLFVRKMSDSISKTKKSEVPLSFAVPFGPKTYKCAMVWRNTPVQLEFLSFVVFDSKEYVGSFPFWGVGGAWVKGTEGAVGKILVMGKEEQDSKTVYRIAKLGNSRNFGKTYDALENIKNERGLDMTGSITIPKGGGASDVMYPPGWSESEKAYARTLKVAPNQAHCVEGFQGELGDIFRSGLGVIQ